MKKIYRTNIYRTTILLLLAAILMILSSLAIPFKPRITIGEMPQKVKLYKNLRKLEAPVTFEKNSYKFLLKELNKRSVNNNLNKFEKIQTTKSPLTGITYDRFQQKYNGVVIEGGEQIVSNSKLNEAFSLKGNFYQDIKGKYIPECADIQKDAALNVVESDLGYPDKCKVTSSSFVIFPFNNEYYLAHKIKITTSNGPYLYYINADNGDIICKASQLIPADGRGSGYKRSPFYNNLEELPLKNLDGSGYLRGSYVNVLKFKERTFGVDIWENYAYDRNLNFTTTNISDDKINGVMAYYHTNKAHDYFKNEFGFNGLDRQMKVILFPETEMRGVGGCYNIEEKKIHINKHSAKESGLFYHEYTHAVMFALLPNRWSNMEYVLGGINEAYPYYFECSINNNQYVDPYINWWHQQDVHARHPCENKNQYPETFLNMNWKPYDKWTIDFGSTGEKVSAYLTYPSGLEYFYYQPYAPHPQFDSSDWSTHTYINWREATQMLNNAFWDIRELIGRHWTDKIVFESIMGLYNESSFEDAAQLIADAAEPIINQATLSDRKKKAYLDAINDVLYHRGLISYPSFNLDPLSLDHYLRDYYKQDKVSADSPDVFLVSAFPGAYVIEVKTNARSLPKIEVFDEQTCPVVNDYSGLRDIWTGVFGTGNFYHPLINYSLKAKIINTRPDSGKILLLIQGEEYTASRFYIKISTDKTTEFDYAVRITNDIPEYLLNRTKWDYIDKKSPKIYSFNIEYGIPSMAYRWIDMQLDSSEVISGNKTLEIYYATADESGAYYINHRGNNYQTAKPLVKLRPGRNYIIFEPSKGLKGNFTFTIFNKDLEKNALPDITFFDPSKIRKEISIEADGTVNFSPIKIINQTKTAIKSKFKVTWFLNGRPIKVVEVNGLEKGGTRVVGMPSKKKIPLNTDVRFKSYKIMLKIDREGAISEASEDNNMLIFDVKPQSSSKVKSVKPQPSSKVKSVKPQSAFSIK